MSQSITDRMSHVMQINELMSDSIEISYHFDELSNVIDSAMHGTSLIHIPVVLSIPSRTRDADGDDAGQLVSTRSAFWKIDGK
eukprot:COSAG02_NODE_1207_length_13885_cov_124.791237_18_plen_83_part_00